MPHQHHNEGVKQYIDELEVSNNLFSFASISKHLPLGEEVGDAFFCDASISASGNGTTWATAVKTITELNALMTTNRGDYGFIAQGNYDENTNSGGVLITKSNCHYIAEGFNLVTVDNSNATATAVFTISGSNCEIMGFYIDETSTDVEGILTSGTTTGHYIHHNYFQGLMENGIHLVGVNAAIIEYNLFDENSDDGIELTGICKWNRIRYNEIFSADDNGISLNANDVKYNYIYKNNVNGDNGTTTYCIQVILGDGNMIMNNTMAQAGTNIINDTGSNNIWENPNFDKISGSFNLAVADGVAITDKVTDIDMPCSGTFRIQLENQAAETAGEGGTISYWTYTKPDFSNYRITGSGTWIVGVDSVFPNVEINTVSGDSKVKIASQCSVVVTANRICYYVITKK